MKKTLALVMVLVLALAFAACGGNGSETTVPSTAPTTEPTTVPTTEPTTVPTTEPGPVASVGGIDLTGMTLEDAKTALTEAARADGFPLVVDGTNASDAEDDRPGMRALRELGVRSPLRECGLSKNRIRQLAREAGIAVWDRPSYACLATRVATGQPITKELLRRIEQAENALFAMGFSDFRLRVRGNAALLQLPVEQHPAARQRWQELEHLLSTFDNITLDPQPRRSL